MKKISKTSIWILIALLAIVLPFFHTENTQMLYSLKNYSGRVVSPRQVDFGNFRVPLVEVSLEEAVAWGNDAVMTNDMNRCRIDVWRPDPATTGVFQHAQIVNNFWPLCFYNYQIWKGEIWKVARYPFEFVFYVCLACLVMFAKAWFAGKK